MRKFKRRQRHSLRFGLFLAVMAALLLPGAVAPRANAEVDANFSWTGVTAAGWNNPGNWSPLGPPGPGDTAVFNQLFINQPNLTTGVSVGTVWMTTGVVQNVTLSGPGTLNLTGLSMVGTGILVDNPNAFTLTITAPVSIGNGQAWTNNSANLFTVSGTTVGLGGNALTVNGTGNTLISGAVVGTGGSLTKDGSGTLTITGNGAYTGGTTVNVGTLLVNTGGDLGTAAVTVNNSGTLGGNATAATPIGARVTVAAGGNLAPGTGGNTTAILGVGLLTLQAASNFRIDINGTTVGSQYDRLVVNGGGGAGGAVITNSNLLVHVGTTLVVGNTFTIMTHNDGFTGQFAQGTTVTGDNGTVFSVSYSGNSIVLTVLAPVPEPSTWIGGALAIAGLAFTQRRRLQKVIAFSR